MPTEANSEDLVANRDTISRVAKDFPLTGRPKPTLSALGNGRGAVRGCATLMARRSSPSLVFR
jgi:hypothetical protein